MREALQKKIKTLDELMWLRRLKADDIDNWLSNFARGGLADEVEQLHALFLLSQFSLFSDDLMRVLLRALFRDFIQRPLYLQLRKKRKNTTNLSVLESAYLRQLKRYRFLAIGNPSESGTHLLYYFRQENELPTNLFLQSHELLSEKDGRVECLRNVSNLVFLDDFCGSGDQAARYSRAVLERLQKTAPRVVTEYFPLFGTHSGLQKVRERTYFNRAEALCELDGSFKSLEPNSRYFSGDIEGVNRASARQMCLQYGRLIEPNLPLGYCRCQLLLGFSHNIPNNSLPIFWSEGSSDFPWKPLFPRYKKGKSW